MDIQDTWGWSQDETKCLLSICKQKYTSKTWQLYRNRAIYEAMAKQLVENSYNQSWLQCHQWMKTKY